MFGEPASSGIQTSPDKSAIFLRLQENRVKAQEEARVKAEARKAETPKTEVTQGQTLSLETQALRQTAVGKFLEGWLMNNMITRDPTRWVRRHVQGGIDFAVGMQESVKAAIEATGDVPRLDRLQDLALHRISEAKVAAKSPTEKQTYDKKREELIVMWQGMLGELAVVGELDGFGDDVIVSAESRDKKELDAKGVDQIYFRYLGIKEDENHNPYHALEMIGVQVKCRKDLNGATIADFSQKDDNGQRPGL